MNKCSFVITSSAIGDLIIIYNIRKRRFLYFMQQSHSVHTVQHRSTVSFHSSCASDLNLQCRAQIPLHCTPLVGQPSPLLSLTRTAGTLALVKLTSSLNYANKAIVICICTARWHVARGEGVGGRADGGEGGHGWNLFMWRGQLIKAPPQVPMHTDKHVCAKKKRVCEGSHGVRWQRWGKSREGDIFSSAVPRPARIYRLQAEWLVQVQSTDKTQYITGKQTSARVSTQTTLII